MRRFIKPDIIFYFSLLLLGLGGFFLAVIWPQREGFYAFTASASLAGLGVALYIYYAKRHKKNLACPTGSDCNAVVKSRYSVFFGIPLEFWGIFYYGAIFLSYLALILLTDLRTGPLISLLIVLTSAAFLFSLYLIFVQAFLLRQWCIWCLLSAALSIAIFILVLPGLAGATTFLLGIKPFLVLLRDIGFVLGVGGATSAVFLFFKFLKDFDIDEREAGALKGTSELIWLGLALIFVSKYALYVVQPQELAQSGRFLAQIIPLSVVFLSGAVLKIIFAPFLVVLPFKKGRVKTPLDFLRKATLITGAVALASWYFAFAVSYLPEYSFVFFLWLYALLVALAIAAALVLERIMSRFRYILTTPRFVK